MGSRDEKAAELFANGYNCAQAVLGAFCEEAGLDRGTALKLANGFGGGMRCGEICGAVSGAVMVIGLKCGFHIEKDLEQKAFCNAKTYEFIERFAKDNGSVLCRDLLGVDIRRPEDHGTPLSREAHQRICPNMIKAAVRLLERMAFERITDEAEIQKEIEYYNAMPYVFDGFFELPELSDGVIHLVCTAKKPAIPEKKYVPAYVFAVCKGSEKIGEVNLRVGYKGFGPDLSSLYYGGQIGYGIDEKYRGNGYAPRACRLLEPVIRAHGMKKLLITNELTNTASRRVCEKLGARFLRVAEIPEWHDLYKEGQRFVNIFEWSVEFFL